MTNEVRPQFSMVGDDIFEPMNVAAELIADQLAQAIYQALGRKM